MTGPAAESLEEELANYPMEGGEYVLGGVELHSGIVDLEGRQEIKLTYLSAVTKQEITEEGENLDYEIMKGCRASIGNFHDLLSSTRFSHAARKDAGRDRCWYRIMVTARPGPDGGLITRVTDTIDPAFVLADHHVKFRAKKFRAFWLLALKETKFGVVKKE